MERPSKTGQNCFREMIHASTIAVAEEVPIDRLWHAVPAFPTISEVWLRLLEALEAELICPT